MTTHTEKAALETWCPWTTITESNLISIANDYADGHQTMLAVMRAPTDSGCVRPACIASKCQMWDWSGMDKHRGECGLKRGKT